MAAVNAYFLTIIILLIIICDAKLPKEYQIDKSKWKNPSDHYTRISITDENDENVCTNGDDCDSIDFNENQQQEWLFAWITVAGGINVMIISSLFLCFIIICRKRTPSISLPSDTEQIISDASENISTELENSKEMESKAEDIVTVDNLEVDDTAAEKMIDEKNTNLPPKIEFENEFDIFGPIESESEKESEEVEKILPPKIDPFLVSSSTTTLLTFDDEIKSTPPPKVDTDIPKIQVKPELTPPSLNNPIPHDSVATTTSTDDDEDFFVIGKKDND